MNTITPGTISTGNIGIHNGRPEDDNPYKGTTLWGDDRVEALKNFMEGKSFEGHTYWYMPAEGNAFELTRENYDLVNWHSLNHYLDNTTFGKIFKHNH